MQLFNPLKANLLKANPIEAHSLKTSVSLALALTLCNCGGSGTSNSNATNSSSIATSASSAATSDASTSSSANSTVSSNANSTVNSSSSANSSCAALATNIEQLVCMADAFKATLTSSELASLEYNWSDSKAKTTWSNFPTAMVKRNGLQFANLNATSLAAAKALVATALSEEGYKDFIGTLAADDYLGKSAGGYGSNLYSIAFIGTPIVNGSWMLQIGGHHLAYNITYLSGTGYPTPNHIGAEPKAAFELNSATYAPLADEGNALVAMFNGLTSSELDYAYLTGQAFSDVIVGPDNGSGKLPTSYPTGSKRSGKLVSDLTTTQKALVTAAIEQWIKDYPSAIADKLKTDYTSDAAYADTYIAWAGTKSKGVDVDTSGTYMRIDGPRLWIEVACQNGVVIQGKTHYHTIFRDKTMDYGNSL